MDKRIIETNIIRNERIAGNIFEIAVKYPEMTDMVRPGRFVNLYLNSKEMLLPRPISICRYKGEELALVYAVVGKGTAELSKYPAGTAIRISVPLGNGFDIDASLPGCREKTAIIAGGGLGVPPLLMLAHELAASGAKVIAALGFRSEPILTDDFRKLGAEVHVATENGSAGFTGNVVELIKEEGLKADLYFACGPKPMLKAISNYCASMNKDVQISLEERMGCGYGACVGCTCKIKDPADAVLRKKVCSDGPVFWGKEVVWDD